MPSQHLIRNQSEWVVNSNIKLLREQNQFFDVSLLCEDGARLAAHKVILAAHSDKFRQILEQMSSSDVLQTPVHLQVNFNIFYDKPLFFPPCEGPYGSSLAS